MCLFSLKTFFCSELSFSYILIIDHLRYYFIYLLLVRFCLSYFVMKFHAILVLLITLATTSSSHALHHHLTHITLIGSYGDLAKRYLWKGFFNLYRQYENDNNLFRFYGGGRNEYAVGSPMLEDILSEKLSCSTSSDTKACASTKQSFIESVNYVQLKTSEQYESLCNTLRQNYLQHCSSEVGCHYNQIFYLSVPSTAYEGINRPP